MSHISCEKSISMVRIALRVFGVPENISNTEDFRFRTTNNDQVGTEFF